MELSAEQKSILMDLKCLVQTRKEPTKISHLVRDYAEMNGYKPQITGFASLTDFLRASGAFNFTSYEGQTAVTARATEKSAHILEMVMAQAKRKKGMPKRFVPPPRQVRGGYSNWNPERFTRQPGPYRGPKRMPFNNNSMAINNNFQKQRPIQKQPMRQLPPLVDRAPLPSQMTRVRMTPSETPRQTLVMRPPVSPPQRPTAAPQTRLITRMPLHPQLPNLQEPPPPLINLPGKQSVQQRLLKARNSNEDIKSSSETSSSNESFQSANGHSAESLPAMATPPQSPPAITEWDMSHLTNVQKLEAFCNIKGCAPPNYQYFPVRQGKQMRNQCRLTIDGATYSTYPDDFVTKLEAKEYLAAKTVEQFRQEETERKFPRIEVSEAEIVDKIYQLVKQHEKGIFLGYLLECFRETYQKSLPAADDTRCILESYSDFFHLEFAIKDYIVYALNEPSLPGSENGDETAVPQLTLKWDQKTWSVLVTNPISTREIWCRLIGDDYSTKLDNMLDELESACQDQLPPVVYQPIVGTIYLTCISDCWHRVRVIGQKEESVWVCFLIDNGEREFIATDQLYICDPHYLELPAQALRFSLVNLEDFSELFIEGFMVDMLSGKALVAEILTAEDKFEGTVRAVFYDTSSDEDINLNQALQERLASCLKPPSIDHGSFKHVIVTHVDADGTVFGILKEIEMRTITTLIQTITDLQPEGFEGFDPATRRFLVKNGGKWHRAEAVEGDQMFLLDVGRMIKRTPTTEIIRLDCLNALLTVMPPQAIRMRLHAVDLTPNTIQLMRGMLTTGIEVMTKAVGGEDQSPIEVKMVLRQTNGLLLPVNETLRTQNELQPSLNDSFRESSLTSTSGGIASESNKQSMDECESDLIPQFQSLNLKSAVPDFVAPPRNKHFAVNVINASNPGLFTVQPFDTHSALRQLQENMQVQYGRDDSTTLSFNQICVGEVYAAKHSDEEDWFRVEVLQKHSETHIHVIFCDFGDVDVLCLSRMRLLASKFRSLPRQAHKASLGVRATSGGWQTDDATRFQQLVNNKRFYALLKDLDTDDITQEKVFVLELIDTSSSKDIFISKVLIDEGRAVPMIK